MAFLEALKYPFHSQNRPVLLRLFIGAVIAVIPIQYMMFNSNINVLLLTMLITWLFCLVYMLGYLVEVIRRLITGDTQLPMPHLLRDFKHGFVVTLITALYTVPFTALFKVMFTPARADQTVLYGMLYFFVVLIGCIVLIPGLVVGLLRYVKDDSIGALINMVPNIRTAFSNRRATVNLLLQLIGMHIVYTAILQVLAPALSGLYFVFAFLEPVLNLILPVLTTIMSAGFLMFVLLPNLSNAHIWVNYGAHLGIVPMHKAKRKSKDEMIDFEAE